MRKRIKLDNIEIIDGVCKGDDYVINYLYKEYFTQIYSYIKQNSGELEDAKDIFQDAILIIYQKASNERLIITVEFKTFLIAICKNIWGRKLKREKKFKNILNDISNTDSIIENLEKSIEDNERKKLYFDHFDLLSDNCIQVIKLFNEGKSIKEIAEIMGIESVKYAKLLRHRCKEKLLLNIKGDLRYKELIND